MSFEANGVHVRAKQSCGCVWDLGVIQSPLMSARSSDGFFVWKQAPFFHNNFRRFQKMVSSSQQGMDPVSFFLTQQCESIAMEAEPEYWRTVISYIWALLASTGQRPHESFYFEPQIFTPLSHRLYDGILCDVFKQKALVAWDNAPSSRIKVSLLLPGLMGADEWLHKVRANMWHPASFPTKLLMRRRAQQTAGTAYLDGNQIWFVHAQRMGLNTVLHRRLFLYEFAEESCWLENPKQEARWAASQIAMESCREWFWVQATAQFPCRWVSAPYFQRLDQQDVLSWQWMDY